MWTLIDCQPAGAGRTGKYGAGSHAELRRVVLVESDQYYREVLTVVLLSQGFVVHAFTDGASLLGSLATAVGADLAVLDWDLSGMSGSELLAQLRQHGVKPPVVFLADKVIAGDDNDQCLLVPQEALDAYECMAFDQGAVDFIAKSRCRSVDRRRIVRTRTKQFSLCTWKLASEIEIDQPITDGSVCRAVHRYVDDCRRALFRRHIDTGTFDLVAKHIGWRALYLGAKH